MERSEKGGFMSRAQCSWIGHGGKRGVGEYYSVAMETRQSGEVVYDEH